MLTNDIRTLLTHPDSLPGVMPFWNYIAFESTLPARDRAILMLRTAWLSRSRYLWAKYATGCRGTPHAGRPAAYRCSSRQRPAATRST